MNRDREAFASVFWSVTAGVLYTWVASLPLVMYLDERATRIVVKEECDEKRPVTSAPAYSPVLDVRKGCAVKVQVVCDEDVSVKDERPRVSGSYMNIPPGPVNTVLGSGEGKAPVWRHLTAEDLPPTTVASGRILYETSGASGRWPDPATHPFKSSHSPTTEAASSPEKLAIDGAPARGAGPGGSHGGGAA